MAAYDSTETSASSQLQYGLPGQHVGMVDDVDCKCLTSRPYNLTGEIEVSGCRIAMFDRFGEVLVLEGVLSVVVRHEQVAWEVILHKVVMKRDKYERHLNNGLSNEKLIYKESSLSTDLIYY